jgi:hypothetical protein
LFQASSARLLYINECQFRRHILSERTQRLPGAAVDIAHFEIIVKAMLSWSDEPKPSRKTLGRAAWPEDEEGGEEEQVIVEDDEDEEDDDEPATSVRAAPAAAKSAVAADPATGFPVVRQLDYAGGD